MAETPQKIAVLGAGSWGTALAMQLARRQHHVRLWGRDADHVQQIDANHENQRYLPGHRLPPNLDATSDLDVALDAVDAVIIAVPSHGFREFVGRINVTHDLGFGIATKGLEHGSGLMLHQVLREELGADRAVALISGPTFAQEVAQGLPTAITVASDTPGFADQVAALLHGGTFRCYAASDMAGVAVGGAVKNIMAIAAGIADGLGFGANSRAALITRGLSEITRFGLALNGQTETFMGLAGLGDLVLTCTDNQSRNRRLGLALGRGEPLAGAQAAIGQVTEGVDAARQAYAMAAALGVDMPITEQVYRVLFEQISPREAVQALFARSPTRET